MWVWFCSSLLLVSFEDFLCTSLLHKRLIKNKMLLKKREVNIIASSDEGQGKGTVLRVLYVCIFTLVHDMCKCVACVQTERQFCTRISLILRDSPQSFKLMWFEMDDDKDTCGRRVALHASLLSFALTLAVSLALHTNSWVGASEWPKSCRVGVWFERQ